MTSPYAEGPLSGIAVGPGTPSVARVYDFLLGGKDNFAADRRLAAQVLERTPDAAKVLRANRAFLGRAVRYLAAGAGVMQFLDVGTGLPSGQNVHEIARAIAPAARVVYVDNDPVVRVHAQALLGEQTGTGVVEADLRDPAAILEHPTVRRLLDLDRPVALILVAILHFIGAGDHPYEIVRTLTRALPSGSHLVISHAIARPDVQQAADLYKDANQSAHLRTCEQIAGFFDGLDLVEPGLVPVNQWRSGISHGQPVWFVGGIGRKD